MKLLKKNKKIILPVVRKGCQNGYFSYPILINNRDKVAKVLKSKYGIDTRIAYKKPIYLQKIYKNKNHSYRKLNCPNAKIITSKILNLNHFSHFSLDGTESLSHFLSPL